MVAGAWLTVRIDGVRLPLRVDQKQVTFSAYAFNEDRVKSATESRTFDIPKQLRPRQGKAYVITIGVNRTQSSPEWDLKYAARDARELRRVVSENLGATGHFEAVVPICLISDHPDSQEKHYDSEIPATKQNLQTMLDLLAGRDVREASRRQLIRQGLVVRAQPEDLVLITISSHGYTDLHGAFHFVLSDVAQPQKMTGALDQSTLNTDQLSAWLREVDAGEIVMIVDACQSEATVKIDGFKPGPMGSRGLGQLAYDKGMRVLAASKAKESAFERDRDERGRDIRQGLLSYALSQEGLVQRKADINKDGKITMGEWLAYAEEEVPKLFKEGHSKGSVQRKGSPEGARDGYLGTPDDTPPRYQQPILFDFHKGKREITILEK